MKERDTLRIACHYDDSHSGMGYIYLKQPTYDNEITDSKNDLVNHITLNQISIPYINDISIATYLDKMRIATDTFKADHGERYNTEYGNDMDKLGYITGIELTLHHDKFIDLVKNQAFKVIRTEWKDREFHLITFDHTENIFRSDNVIYKLTNEEDAFAIVQLVEAEELGIKYSNIKDKLPIALYKALISARDDIYPLEYLLKPEFVMRKE
jgi:hypothetical protein